jgi:capsid protein
VRAVSWFAPVIVRLKEFDEYEDATLMKQKIAACLAVITTDVDGTAPALGTADDTQTPAIDGSSLAPSQRPPGDGQSRAAAVGDRPRDVLQRDAARDRDRPRADL